MLKRHLPRVIYHRLYQYTKVNVERDGTKPPTVPTLYIISAANFPARRSEVETPCHARNVHKTFASLSAPLPPPTPVRLNCPPFTNPVPLTPQTPARRATLNPLPRKHRDVSEAACVPMQWSQGSGSNVIPRRARPGLAGLRPHTQRRLDEAFSSRPVRGAHSSTLSIHQLWAGSHVVF